MAYMSMRCYHKHHGMFEAHQGFIQRESFWGGGGGKHVCMHVRSHDHVVLRTSKSHDADGIYIMSWGLYNPINFGTCINVF